MDKVRIPDIPMMAYHERLKISEIIKKLKPNKCLEWGSGKSTLFFPEEHKDIIKRWDSMEHDKDWYDELLKNKLPDNVNLFLSKLPSYITFISGKYDFIFVDGIERIKCIKHVQENKLLNKNGVLILHDSGRTRYQTASNYFKYNQIVSESVGIGLDGGPDFNGLTVFSDEPITI